MKRKLIISVDFDGIIVSNRSYPVIETKHNLMAKSKLDKWSKQGHKIIINTCRVGDALDKAVEFLNREEIHYDAINENLPERIAEYGMDCRKISADVYIDDKSIFLYDKFGSFYDIDWHKLDDAIEKISNRCPKCNSEMKSGWKYCPICGDELHD